MCLEHVCLDLCSPWPWGYGILIAGCLGQMPLFLPFEARLTAPYLNGAMYLARQERGFL